MKKINPSHHACAICEKSFPVDNLVSGKMVCKKIADEIKQTSPAWSVEDYICHADLALMRSRYVHSLLLAEKGELTTLEHAVLGSLNDQSLLATSLETASEQTWTMAERLSDKLANFGGSWWFLICFGLFLTSWILINSLVYWLRPTDPYPFIFLNLILSCLTAIQAPIIMMSQNRQEVKDRLRSQHDYQINLKAELEIRNLHDKMDHLLLHQWEKMVQIQEIQLEILTELSHQRGAVVMKKTQ